MKYRNLFTSNFRKRCKKIGKGLLGILVVIVLYNMIISGLNYLYVDGSANEWERILWHNYYAEEDNIDYLYLGSSHVYQNLNPFLLDELNGENNFNFSTSSQKLNGSYYLLKEADKTHELKHVYVELFYLESTEKTGKFLTNKAGRITNWRNTDYMRNSVNRLEYMLTMSSPEYYVETWFPFVRYREQIFDLDYVRSQVEYKQMADYQNFIYYDENGEYVEEYRNKGYCYSTKVLQESQLNISYIGRECSLKEKPMTKEAELYLRKIIMYCKENDIEITFFSAPMCDLYILADEYNGSYDNYVNQIESIVAEYGVDYYDFNLCKEAYLPTQELENFRDTHHLNAKGAELFTQFFYKVMQGTKEENEKYFYNSYTEKLYEMDGRIYGLLRINSEEEENNVCYEIASNWKEGMEYRIFLTPEDKETKMLQDFSENTMFAVPKEEHGICTVMARKIGETDKVQTLEIEY